MDDKEIGIKAAEVKVKGAFSMILRDNLLGQTNASPTSDLFNPYLPPHDTLRSVNQPPLVFVDCFGLCIFECVC